MTVALVTAHRSNGFFIFRPGQGWEYVAVLALSAVALAVLGPGEASLDDALGITTDLDGGVGLALSAGLGLTGGAAVSCGLLAPRSRRPERAEHRETSRAPVDMLAEERSRLDVLPAEAPTPHVDEGDATLNAPDGELRERRQYRRESGFNHEADSLVTAAMRGR